MDPYLEAHHRALQSYKASEEIGVWPSLTYMLHIFAFLLIHRKIKVEKNCRRKYGEDWKEYRTTVPWRLLSQIKKRNSGSIRFQSKNHSRFASRTTRHCRETSNKGNISRSAFHAELASISAVALLFSCYWCKTRDISDTVTLCAFS